MSKESIKEKLSEYIEFMSEILNELDRPDESRSDFSVSDSFVYYDMSDLQQEEQQDTSIKAVYIPEVEYYRKPKCNKCYPTREIRVDDNFTNHTKMCECFYTIPVLKVKEIKIIGKKKNCYLTSDGCFIYDDCVLNSFDESQLSIDSSAVVYSSREACEEYCNRRNQ